MAGRPPAGRLGPWTRTSSGTDCSGWPWPFLISRYREALASGLEPRPALVEALTHGGQAIAASAAVVVAMARSHRLAREGLDEARLAVEGEPAELGPDARLALYRTAQEALTNVRRHAQATCVDLRLRWQPEGAGLTVENDGVAPGAGPPRAGYGLAGMRERAELLGGKLDLGADDGRFRVRLWVPAVAPTE